MVWEQKLATWEKAALSRPQNEMDVFSYTTGDFALQSLYNLAPKIPPRSLSSFHYADRD